MLGMEIERRFLIRMPEQALLSGLESTHIDQTYIVTDEGRARLRRRGAGDEWKYILTRKKRVSPISCIEDEREIGENEYRALLEKADPKRKTIKKTRYILQYLGQSFEIDVFSFWRDRAIMELELESEEQTIFLPPDIRVIKEISQDKRYTNSALAVEVLYEKI